MTTEPEWSKSAIAAAAKADRGMLWSLLLGFLAACLGCAFTIYHVQQGAQLAEDFHREMPAVAALYVMVAPAAFVFPILLLLLGLMLTRAGKTRQRFGAALAIALFVFALAWAAIAVFTFADIYDPPRTVHKPTGVVTTD